MLNPWASNAIFYHIYPLGLCGAPRRNDFYADPQPRLDQLYDWIPHLRSLGVTALYLGPLFESSAHGYDTADYYHLDRRLGSDDHLARLAAALHEAGIRLVLDGVFNHVGRDFWAFRDLRQNGPGSAYRDWFREVDFSRRSPQGDPFSYRSWQDHSELVELNLNNPQVRHHLLQAVRHWIEAFGIAGLRLDVADSLDLDFQRELAAFCRALRPDFWLMGEVIHGDYRHWANPETLDSVTNYEAYKGLYSSHVERNYFEIAYTLQRQFGEQGVYRGLGLYNFADNHDVNRVASRLKDPAHLYPLYCLLFSMPGIPSIYYGSEWGLAGARSTYSDASLRPHLILEHVQDNSPHPDLLPVLQRLARIRIASVALRQGDYTQLAVAPEQLAFARTAEGETAIVLLNAAEKLARLDLPVPLPAGSRLVDALNEGETFRVTAGRLRDVTLYPRWARILIAATSPPAARTAR